MATSKEEYCSCSKRHSHEYLYILLKVISSLIYGNRFPQRQPRVLMELPNAGFCICTLNQGHTQQGSSLSITHRRRPWAWKILQHKNHQVQLLTAQSYWVKPPTKCMFHMLLECWQEGHSLPTHVARPLTTHRSRYAHREVRRVEQNWGQNLDWGGWDRSVLRRLRKEMEPEAMACTRSYL